MRRWLVPVLTAAALAAPPALHSPAEAAVALTARQLAGQRVVYSYPGLVPPQSLLDRVRAGEAAGVIFFGENISSPTQIAGVVAQLRQAAAASPVPTPLLLMTDQEGGQIRRLPGAPELSQKQVGQLGTTAAADAGTSAGNNLRGVGMNVNLAPVADVYRTPGDLMDQYGRSYSTNSASVGVLSRTFIQAQQATGVAATAKHFPGLGPAAATENTDLRPVTVSTTLSDLRTKDEPPYDAAVSVGVKLVMLSWAVYPALDPNRPAGLSRTVVQGELRQGHAFRGVTISDALEAGALQAYGGTGNRAVLCAQAGVDLILASARDTGQGDQVVTALSTAYTGGTLDRAEFTASTDRVLALRASLP
ncbi:glycoside hydrolase family 3 N-terminal domain-containing protein [Actinokineospora bangkokensis]|uniref:glycoside hydrolase family 3 N-terminal domain-containing protein n=1 Tax=Actinokineospora bangkokensis TaxID=1193682 RepID=UPI000A074520|nr:glycoside hydrolase family 3 N-terminal domain-containing protein [Actinokineospora bangkokensis]